MKELIFVALATCCISISLYASDGSVTVNRGQGTYQVGFKCCPTAPKVPSIPKGTNGIDKPNQMNFIK